MNNVETNNADMKTSLFPYLSARPLEKEIPTIINMIPPALNNPKPAETGSSPKKFRPIKERKDIIGSINKPSASSLT